jgi:hypothetical protein
MFPLVLQNLILEFHDSFNLIEKRTKLHQEFRMYFFPGFYQVLFIMSPTVDV